VADLKLNKLLDMVNSLTKIDSVTGVASLDLANEKVDGSPAKFKKLEDWLNAVASFDVVAGENPSGSINIESLDSFLSTGDASPDLEVVLTEGNTTGGADIIITSGDQIISEADSGLVLTAGDPTAGNGEDITITASDAFATGGGDGGNIILQPGNEDGAGAEGQTRLMAADASNYVFVEDYGVVGMRIAPSTGNLRIGPNTGSGQLTLTDGNDVQAIRIKAGDRRLTDQNLNSIFQWDGECTIAAAPVTSGNGQDVDITASAAFASGGGDGGNINLRPGDKDGAGTEGAVRMYGVDNDDYIYVEDYGVAGMKLRSSGYLILQPGSGSDDLEILDRNANPCIRIQDTDRRLSNNAGLIRLGWREDWVRIYQNDGTTIQIEVNETGVGFFGATPAAQPAHIADATGGSTVDAEARTAINALLAQMATLGLQAAS